MSNTEKHVFQAEIQQLLDIVIHSLYTDREIFIRELISNAADACEKLRFLQASGQEVVEKDVAPAIRVTTDEQAGTITFTDTGLGMTRAELVQNLGTIAHSGTKAFLKHLAEEKRQDARLIGQFGVGFYSAFMVASTVTVISRSAQPGEPPAQWTSSGGNGYELSEVAEAPRGTSITLTLKDDAKQFAKNDEVTRIIERYSTFVPFDIELNGKKLNTVQALWSRNKSEIKEEEYQEFYRFIGHDYQDPMLRLHFTADAPLSIQSLLFVPAQNFEAMGMGRTESQVNLYCRKVLIQAKSKDLFPEWLRFLKGVVDSEDLPLNISRESMQDTNLMQRLNKVLTSRFLKFLEETAEKDPALYEKFYNEYQRFIKEGAVTDFTHREPLSRLLRFSSSTSEPGKNTSLAEYVKRMQPDQKEIFYLLAPHREAALASPYYEVFAARKLEVLFLTDPWDEFVMDHLQSFDGKNLKAAEKADLNLDDQPKGALSESDSTSLVGWLKETLGKDVNEVRLSKRLVGSPLVALDNDRHMTASMRRILRAAKRDGTEPAPATVDLEINPGHALMERLHALKAKEPALAGKVAHQMYDHARAAAGLLEDPRPMLARTNELIAELLSHRA